MDHPHHTGETRCDTCFVQGLFDRALTPDPNILPRPLRPGPVYRDDLKAKIRAQRAARGVDKR